MSQVTGFGSKPSHFLKTFINLSFVYVFQLLDLCVLDVESLQFTYSVMAASALYHSSSRELALSVSGWYSRINLSRAPNKKG